MVRVGAGVSPRRRVPCGRLPAQLGGRILPAPATAGSPAGNWTCSTDSTNQLLRQTYLDRPSAEQLR